MDILSNIDWASYIGGIISFGLAAIGYWRAIPASKKNAAKEALEDGLSDSNLTLEEAAIAALKLL